METNTSKYANPCALCKAHVEYPSGVYLRGGRIAHIDCVRIARKNHTSQASSTQKPAPDSTSAPSDGFDYEHQAWFKGGVYVRCGHPDAMDCRCYGKVHEGEAVAPEVAGR